MKALVHAHSHGDSHSFVDKKPTKQGSSKKEKKKKKGKHVHWEDMEETGTVFKQLHLCVKSAAQILLLVMK